MNRNILLILIIGTLFFGCTSESPQVGSPATGGDGMDDVTSPPTSGGAEDGGEESDAEDDDSTHTGDDDSDTIEHTSEDIDSDHETNLQSADVLMLGRSVTYHWMEDYMSLVWTCFDEDCYDGTIMGEYQGYDFIYHELDYPPEITDSAVEALDTYDSDVVFFKLCFVDFEPDESGYLLQRNKDIIETIYDEVVTKRNRKLIVGNALPMVSEYNDPLLVSDHKAYNSWLADFATSHDGIEVMDFYGEVAASDGSLKSEYAVASDDSHWNNQAYVAVTPDFLELLN